MTEKNIIRTKDELKKFLIEKKCKFKLRVLGNDIGVFDNAEEIIHRIESDKNEIRKFEYVPKKNYLFLDESILVFGSKGLAVLTIQ